MSLYSLMGMTEAAAAVSAPPSPTRVYRPAVVTVRATGRDVPVAVVEELEDGSLVVRVGPGVTLATLDELVPVREAS